jgi:hypothetical protein
VKKTAAVCVAKLYDISPELVRDQGFIDTLRDLISDANPSVGVLACVRQALPPRSSRPHLLSSTPPPPRGLPGAHDQAGLLRCAPCMHRGPNIPPCSFVMPHAAPRLCLCVCAGGGRSWPTLWLPCLRSRSLPPGTCSTSPLRSCRSCWRP